MKNYLTINQKTVEGEREKKIYEIDNGETRDYLLLGEALGINMEHCLALGAKYKENFWKRVSAYRIIEDTRIKKILAEIEKNTGKDMSYISVCFYEKLEKRNLEEM